MHKNRIQTIIIFAVSLWLFTGISTIILFKNNNATPIPTGDGAGWAKLYDSGKENKINFEILDLNTTLIKEGSLLKVSSDKIELKSDSFDYLWWVPFTDKSDILDTLINGDCARVVNIHNIIGRRTRLLVKETVCPTPPLSSNTDSKDSELEQFLKSTMENIHQFKEDVKDYIEDIEKTARDLEEYEKELERSSDKNGEDTL